MKEFFRNVSPVRAIKDLWQILGAPTEYRWRGLAFAVLAPGGIFSVLGEPVGRGLPPTPGMNSF